MASTAQDRLKFKTRKLIDEGFRGGGKPVNTRTRAIAEDRIRRTSPKKVIRGTAKKKVDGTQTGNLGQGVTSVIDRLKLRKRRLESVGR